MPDKLILEDVKKALKELYDKQVDYVHMPMGLQGKKMLDEFIKEDFLKRQNMPENKKKAPKRGIPQKFPKAVPAAEPLRWRPIEQVIDDQPNPIPVKGIYAQMREQQGPLPIGVPQEVLVVGEANPFIKEDMDFFIDHWEQNAMKEIRNAKIKVNKPAELLQYHGKGILKEKEVESFAPDNKLNDTVLLSLDHVANVFAMTRVNAEIGEGTIILRNDVPVIPDQYEDSFTFWYDYYYDILMTMKKARN